jgi:hypothetical protein
MRAWSFGTLTFPAEFFEDRHGRRLSPYGQREKADGAWRGLLAYQQPCELEWVRAVEPHQSQLIHYHALMAGHLPTARVTREHVRMRIATLEADWSACTGGGISRWRPVNTRRVWYLTKYVVKGGELEWSDTFAMRRVESLS